MTHRQLRVEQRNHRWFPSTDRRMKCTSLSPRPIAAKEVPVLHLGAGRDSLSLARQLQDIDFVSLDLDWRTTSPESRARRVLADASRLPFRTGCSGGILCENVFEHLEDPNAVLEEGHRVGWSFLLYPPLRYVNLYGFEYLRFSIPFLAWAFYPLYRRWTELYARMGGWRPASTRCPQKEGRMAIGRATVVLTPHARVARAIVDLGSRRPSLQAPLTT